METLHASTQIIAPGYDADRKTVVTSTAATGLLLLVCYTQHFCLHMEIGGFDYALARWFGS